jgi:hypothetical protein
MSKRVGFLVVWGLLILLPALGTNAVAQEPATPPESDEPVVATAPPEDEPKEKTPFGLFIGLAAGGGDVDPFTSSIDANNLTSGQGTLTIDQQVYGKAAIGWKLPRRKGDFRLIFQGIREDSYEFNSSGVLSVVFDVSAGGSSLRQIDLDSGLVPWVEVDIRDGKLLSTRDVPTWDVVNDEDEDQLPDFGPCSPNDMNMLQCGEIIYDPANTEVLAQGTVADDLANRINTYDVVYGREFGGRRFSSRWWGGFRYFQYEGQLYSGAWLNEALPGSGFTDGAFLNLLRISQDTSGFGPVGSWEAQFNFFDKGVQLFLRGEAAFTFNTMKMDSDPFFQVLDSASGTLLDDRMAKELEKSSWQNRAEVGGRINLKNGLQFELAYSIAGFLDFILMPDLLQLGGTNENPQSATQDIIVHTAHFGVSFQF